MGLLGALWGIYAAFDIPFSRVLLGCVYPLSI